MFGPFDGTSKWKKIGKVIAVKLEWKLPEDNFKEGQKILVRKIINK